MNIAILGAGNIGRTMGVKWARAGHTVTFGARDVNSAKAQTLRASLPSAHIASVANAIQDAQVILLSLPYDAVQEIVSQHAAILANKIIIDATNKFNAPVVNNLTTILRAVPSAHVFRAFNSLGWEVFENARNDNNIEHFYCGPDNAARPIIENLIQEIGVRPVWVGDHASVGIVDALGSLWVTLVFQRGYKRNIALKLVQA